MEAYKKWVRQNRDCVHSLESLSSDIDLHRTLHSASTEILFGLTWLLPERFSASEIGPEAGFVKLLKK